jgi:hypothetical protein
LTVIHEQVQNSHSYGDAVGHLKVYERNFRIVDEVIGDFDASIDRPRVQNPHVRLAAFDALVIEPVKPFVFAYAWYQSFILTL